MGVRRSHPVLTPREGGFDGAPAVSVRGLSVCLTGSHVPIADDVTFSLGRGEVLGVVGESGSGKTAVALGLLAYARPGTTLRSGSVLVDGFDLLALPAKQLRALRGRLVSYVPQDPSSWLNPSLRIGVQLREILDAHGIDDRAARALRVEEMLGEVRLQGDREFLARYPHQLSGGQQQRVALAIAFACRPSLVVLDEPTTGLDVSTQAHVLRTVHELCRLHEVSAVYVSHDIAVVMELATRVAVMYSGRVVEMASAAELMQAPAHPYTRLLLSAVPDPKRRKPLIGLPASATQAGAGSRGCVFVNRCDFAEPACDAAPIERETVSSTHDVLCRRWRHVRQAAGVATRADAQAPAVPAAPGAGTGELMSVTALNAWYAATPVLHDINLCLRAAECLAVVGESGSGKTTLARCISGIHTKRTGAITFGGTELSADARSRSAEMRKAIQYIFQNPLGALNPRKTVYEVIEQPLRVLNMPSDRGVVLGLLDQVSLPASYADRLPGRLSGGEQQRVAIARALAAQPSLLVCDEITSALDVSVQASILALLMRLRAETGLSILFITHNVAVVRAVADTVVVLSEGAIVERGAVAEVLDRPQHPYTQMLLRDTPSLVDTMPASAVGGFVDVHEHESELTGHK